MAARFALALLCMLLLVPAEAPAATTFGAAAALAPMASDTPACCSDEFLAGPTTPFVSGTIEPDADHDGYGDESQDDCPAEAALRVCAAVSG